MTPTDLPSLVIALSALCDEWRDVQTAPDSTFGGCTSREEIDIVKHVHRRCEERLSTLIGQVAIKAFREQNGDKP